MLLVHYRDDDLIGVSNQLLHILLSYFDMPFKNLTVLHVSSAITILHCLLIVLKIYHCSPCHPVIKMFHCLFVVLKISLFSMSSSRDSMIRINVPLSVHCFETLAVFYVIQS